MNPHPLTWQTRGFVRNSNGRSVEALVPEITERQFYGRRRFLTGVIKGGVLVALAPQLVRRSKAADIQDNTDRTLAISAEEYMREFTVPASYVTLRLGFLLTSTLGADALTQEQGWGLCNGTANGYLAANSDHFVGGSVITNGEVPLRTSGTIDYNNADAIGLLAASTGLKLGKRVGSTVTTWTAGSAGGPAGYTGFSGTSNRKAIYLDFTPGSPWTLKYWGYDYVGTHDFTPSEFRDGFRTSTPSPGGQTMKWATGTLSVDEGADGALNAVDMHWGHALSELEIHAVEVWKIA